MSSATRAALAAAAFLFMACDGDGDGEADALVRVKCPLGDLSRPPELEIVHHDETGTLHVTATGDRIPLIIPPQGGHVLYVGARARNIDCRVKLTTSLTDLCHGEVIGLERRPVSLVMNGAWAEPDLPGEPVNIGNLAACPVLGLRRDVLDQPYRLTVHIEDYDGLSAETSLEIVPACPAGDPSCVCECRKDSVLGAACEEEKPGARTPASGCDGGAAGEPVFDAGHH